MALIACRECQKQISDQALTCPQCGAPTAASEALAINAPKKRSIWKWVLGVPVGAFVVLMIIGSCSANTPEGKQRATERSAIELCWESQGRKSNSAGVGQFIAGACEKMERDFRNKWGRSP